MINAYKNFWKNYANFSGRSRRADYWWAMLCQAIVGGVLGILMTIMVTAAIVQETPMGAFGILIVIVYVVFALASIVPGLSVIVRRLHDTGRAGWWFFITFVPAVGSIVLFVFMLLEGTAGENQYGPDPKAE